MPNEAEDAVKKFFTDPLVARKVINLVVKDKPAGFAERSNAPYYKEKYGLILKEAADDMMKTRNDCCFFYKDFPNKSANTIYLMVNQSFRYLIEELDDENKTYAKWATMVNVTRERNVGIRVSFDEHYRNIENTDFVRPRSVIGRDKGPVWKEELDAYLDDDRMTKPLNLTGLMLNPDEIKTQRDSLLQLGDTIIFEVTAQHIKIIKTNI